MTRKTHISAIERDQIGTLLSSGLSLRAVARKLKRSVSVSGWKPKETVSMVNISPLQPTD